MVRQKTILAVTLAEYLFNNKNNCDVSTYKKTSEIKEEKKNINSNITKQYNQELEIICTNDNHNCGICNRCRNLRFLNGISA